MNENLTKFNETVDDLQCSGYRIIQGSNDFRFSIDPVLLANFCSSRPGDRVADFCTGGGIIALLLLAHNKCRHVTAIEIQPQLCERMQRSIAMNNAAENMAVVEADIKNAAQLLGYGVFDHVICNPPYLPAGQIKQDMAEELKLSRYEIALTLQDVCRSAAKVLKNGGKLSLCHRADRADEVFLHCINAGLRPKRARLVQPTAAKPPTLILVEARKQAKPGLKWLPVLNVYSDGKYTDEIYKIYGMENDGI